MITKHSFFGGVEINKHLAPYKLVSLILVASNLRSYLEKRGKRQPMNAAKNVLLLSL